MHRLARFLDLHANLVDELLLLALAHHLGLQAVVGLFLLHPIMREEQPHLRLVHGNLIPRLEAVELGGGRQQIRHHGFELFHGELSGEVCVVGHHHFLQSADLDLRHVQLRQLMGDLLGREGPGSVLIHVLEQHSAPLLELGLRLRVVPRTLPQIVGEVLHFGGGRVPLERRNQRGGYSLATLRGSHLRDPVGPHREVESDWNPDRVQDRNKDRIDENEGPGVVHRAGH
mmetsp:Transcript_56110/g.133207  ORF Transcript_56110/g.133207 Transcript_56110/m.133207 type:complete len:229 (-) Transcript_56110:2352-3038(-)